jgi:cyclopropane-fatty-acyl-phospholipid synthase
MWETYLVGAELSFRNQGMLVFQMQLAKAVSTVPLTRDYITDWERAHGDASENRAA